MVDFVDQLHSFGVNLYNHQSIRTRQMRPWQLDRITYIACNNKALRWSPSLSFCLVSVTFYTLLNLFMTKRFQSNKQQSFMSLHFFIGRAFHNSVVLIFLIDPDVGYVFKILDSIPTSGAMGSSVSLFTKGTDVVPQDLPKSRSREIYNHSEIWQTPRPLCCRAACQISKRYNYYNIHLAASRLREVWQ